MPCNSAHVYFDELKNSIKIPLLNIVEETVSCLPNSKQLTTIFATEITVKSELYQKGIISAGHEFIFMEQWQAKINSIIDAVKMKRDRGFINSLWNELIYEVKNQRIDSVIMACTDLSILSNVKGLKLNIYDSSEALAKSVVKKYLRCAAL